MTASYHNSRVSYVQHMGMTSENYHIPLDAIKNCWRSWGRLTRRRWARRCMGGKKQCSTWICFSLASGEELEALGVVLGARSVVVLVLEA